MKTMFEEKFGIAPKLLLAKEDGFRDPASSFKALTKKELCEEDEALFHQLLIEALAAEHKPLPAKKQVFGFIVSNQVFHVVPEHAPLLGAGFASLDKIPSQDKDRKILHGIYCDKGSFVASDGRMIVIVPARNSPLYQEGAILGLEGVKGKYPNYLAVLDDSPNFHSEPIDIIPLLGTLKGIARLYGYVSGAIDILPIKFGEELIYFRVSELFKVLQSLASNGAKKIIIRFIDKAHNIHIDTDVDGLKALLAPTMSGEGLDCLHFDVELSYPLAKS